MSSTTIFILLALALLLAALAAGVPRPAESAAESAAESWNVVVEHDGRLLRGCAVVAAALVAAGALGAVGGPGAWVALALVAGVATPIAVDRWRRTNGDLAGDGTTPHAG